MSNELNFMNDNDDSPEISHKDTIIGVPDSDLEDNQNNKNISFFERVYYFSIDSPVDRLFGESKSGADYFLKLVSVLQLVSMLVAAMAFIANTIVYFKNYFAKFDILKGLYFYLEFSALSLGSIILIVMCFYSIINFVEVVRMTNSMKELNYELHLEYKKTAKFVFFIAFLLSLSYPVAINLPAYYLKSIAGLGEFSIFKDYISLATSLNIFAK